MRARKKILLILLTLVVAFEMRQIIGESTPFTSLIANIYYHGNFHPVTPGKFYRSAEMSSNDLVLRAREHGIRTVVDLRIGGDNPDDGDEAEALALSRIGIQYQHFPLAGSRVPIHEKIRGLVEVFDSAEQPILVHCSSGTHRAGVASALWLMSQGVAADVAAEQLAPKYGFFRLERRLKGFLKGHPTIDQLVWDLQQLQIEHGIELRTWLAASMPVR